MYDVVVIGAGPAGISAGIYAVSQGMKTLVIEKNQVGGLIGKVSTVTHYAGIVEGETGESFAKRLQQQAIQAGVKIVFEEVIGVELSPAIKTIHTEQEVYTTRKVIIAGGTSPRMLEIPGEKALSGKGMRMNAASDGEKYRGKHVYVIGGADGAVKEALYLSGLAKKVTIIHFESSLGCIAEFRKRVEQTSNIELRLNARLHAVYGVDQVTAFDIADEKTGAIETIDDPECGIFVYAGTVPNTSLYSELNLEEGFIPVDEMQQTNLPGVYAVGDICVKKVRQVATAVADGARAAIAAAM